MNSRSRDLRPRGWVAGPSGPLACGLVCLGLTGSLWGQTALRSSLAGSDAAEFRARALRGEAYNLEWGPGRFLASAALSMEANDNVRLTDGDSEGDVIFRPTAGLFSVFQFSERNALRFDLAVGYQKYVAHEEYDSFLVRPGSEMAVDLFVRDTTINLHNRFNYTLDPLEQGTVIGSAEYGGFYDTLGASVLWDRNEMLLSGGYDHAWFLSDVDRFDHLSRQADSVYVRATALPHDAVRWGGEIAGGFSRYAEPFLNDSWNASAGAFLNWAPSRFIETSVRAGFITYQFNDTGRVSPPADLGDYYVDVKLSHRINAWLNYTVAGSRAFDLGVNSDLQDLWKVHATVTWRMHRTVWLSPQAAYEWGSENGATAAERYERLGFSLTTGYQLARPLSLGLTYGLTVRQSELPGRDYVQNRGTLTFTYRF